MTGTSLANILFLELDDHHLSHTTQHQVYTSTASTTSTTTSSSSSSSVCTHQLPPKQGLKKKTPMKFHIKSVQLTSAPTACCTIGPSTTLRASRVVWKHICQSHDNCLRLGGFWVSWWDGCWGCLNGDKQKNALRRNIIGGWFLSRDVCTLELLVLFSKKRVFVCFGDFLQIQNHGMHHHFSPAFGEYFCDFCPITEQSQI